MFVLCTFSNRQKTSGLSSKNLKNAKYGKKSGVLVCQQTIPTERPPLAGEVSANFSG
jgi:hypothetical protein